MTLVAAGFVGTVNDVEWAILNQLGEDGILGFNVSTAGPGTTRQVTVSSGQANVGGVLAVDTASGLVTLDANPSEHPRRDRIILRAVWNGESSTMQLTFRKGTPSPNPQPPALTQNPGTQYEVALAWVQVPSGGGEVAEGDVTRENTPPSPGFFNINSIATAPDPSKGALIFYTPQNSLRVGKGSSYVELASSSSSDNNLPDVPANWSGARRYFLRSGIVWLMIDLLRQNSTSPVNVQLGVLPSDARPRRTWYGQLMTQSNDQPVLVEITTDGVVRATDLSVPVGERLRGSISFPLG